MAIEKDSKPVPESKQAIAPIPGTGAGPGSPPPLGLGKPEDPWIHRATTMRCNTCMFFVIKKPTELGIVANAERGYIGRWRRRCPTMGGYPATFESDWCGDHKLDENKI